MLCEAPGQRVCTAAAQRLDFAIVNVRGIQQIPPLTMPKPANVNRRIIKLVGN